MARCTDLVFLFLAGISLVCVRGEMTVSGLYQKVYRSADKSIAPGEVDPVYNNVTVKVSLVNILEVDTEHQTLEAVVWIYENYTDPRLRWDSDTFGKGKVIIPRSRIWIPDWELYDGLAKMEYFGEYPAYVRSDGAVVRVPVIKIKIRCGAMDSFDRVQCNFRLGSWVYSGNELTPRVHPDGGLVVQDDQEVSPSWSVVMVSASEDVNKYECCPEPYPNIGFTIVVEKKSKCPMK